MDDSALGMENMEMYLAAGAVIVSIFGGVMAVKVDLAKLKTDVCWIKRGLERLEAQTINEPD